METILYIACFFPQPFQAVCAFKRSPANTTAHTGAFERTPLAAGSGKVRFYDPSQAIGWVSAICAIRFNALVWNIRCKFGRVCAALPSLGSSV